LAEAPAPDATPAEAAGAAAGAVSPGSGDSAPGQRPRGPRRRPRRPREPPAEGADRPAEQRDETGPRRRGPRRSGQPDGDAQRQRDGRPPARDGERQHSGDRDMRERGPRGDRRDGRRGPPGGRNPGGRNRDAPRKPPPERRLYSLESVVDRGFEDVEEGEDATPRRVHWTIVKRTVADQKSGKAMSATYVLQRDGGETEFPSLGAARSAVHKTIVHPEKLTMSKAEHVAAKSK
jgi:hypothetical protein